MWVWFWLSVAVFFLGIAGAVGAAILGSGRGGDETGEPGATGRRRGRIKAVLMKVLAVDSVVTPFRLFFGTSAVAIFLLLYPVASQLTEGRHLWGAFPSTLLATMQVFSAQGDLGAALDAFESTVNLAGRLESLYITILFALAPLLAVGFVLTFFQALSTHVRYFLHRWAEVDVFSDLNEQSIALADGLRRNNSKAIIAFTDVILADNEPSVELNGQARRLDALCFKGDILGLPWYMHSRKPMMRFFIMGQDESENLYQARAILDGQKDNKRDAGKTELYVFSDTPEGELALGYHDDAIHVRRINPARTLVYSWLWRDDDKQAGETHQPCGVDLFHGARDEGSAKVIEAVVVGLGGHGEEMLKALAWYCQMSDDAAAYWLKLHAFDIRQDAAERFAAICPELVDGKHGTGAPPAGASPRQDASYKIVVQGDIDATGPALPEALDELSPTFVFIALGDDAATVQTAISLRRYFARRNLNPQILAVSRNSETIRQALVGEKKTGGRELPRISIIGDTKDVYSVESVINSEVELNGLLSHLGWASGKWGDYTKLSLAKWRNAIAQFWRFEYNYSSSTAVPIHWKACRALHTPGVGMVPEQREKETKEFLQRLEHARWCAYMRGEGFIFEPTDDRWVAKTHHLLIDFDKLPKEPPSDERDKDDNDSRDIFRALSTALSDGSLGTQSGDLPDDHEELIRQVSAFLEKASPMVARYD